MPCKNSVSNIRRRSRSFKTNNVNSSSNNSRKSMSKASNVARRTRRTSVDASLFVRIRPLCQRGSLMVTLYRNCSLAFDIPLWFLEKNGQRHRRKESLFCSSAILTSKKHILSYTLYAWYSAIPNLHGFRHTRACRNGTIRSRPLPMTLSTLRRHYTWQGRWSTQLFYQPCNKCISQVSQFKDKAI